MSKSDDDQKRNEASCPPEEPTAKTDSASNVSNSLHSEDSANSSIAIVEAKKTSGAPFPPIEIVGEALEGRNEDRVPRVPIGPSRGPSTPAVPGRVPETKPDTPEGTGSS